jgi:hypothetical protein
MNLATVSFLAIGGAGCGRLMRAFFVSVVSLLDVRCGIAQCGTALCCVVPKACYCSVIA